MKDYEAKFWLPFKGVTRPVYAIPGNHDWYDALEGFAATFLQADAARASIRARVEADLRVTSTTDGRIDELIHEAARLRAGVRRPDGLSARAVLRGPDRSVRAHRHRHRHPEDDRSRAGRLAGGGARPRRGKLTMAILGHPFYAGGHDMTRGDEEFARLKQLLLRHGVAIVMAGDTHDLEYYVEPRLRERRRAPLRQRRRRRLPELRHGAGLARAPRPRPTGRTTRTATP